MEYFNSDSIRRKVAGLPDWKRIAFMAACCERMLPNYETFSRETGFGRTDVLRQALDAIWLWAESDTLLKNLPDLIAEADKVAPDTEGSRSSYTSAALDAANSIAITLEAISEATDDRLVEVASLARDTVDLFVQQNGNLDTSSADFEERITSSPLMQTELTAQNQSLQALNDDQGERRVVAKLIRSEFSQRNLPDR